MKPLIFMGQEFRDAAHLRQHYPAFAGDDSVREIRNGATTPMEVEIGCWKHRNAAYVKARDAAQRSIFKKRALKGIAKSAGNARVRGKKAA